MKYLNIFVAAGNPKQGLLNEFGIPVGGTEKVVMECHERLLENGFESYVIDSVESPYTAENRILAYGAGDGTGEVNQKVAEICQGFDHIVVHSNFTLPKYLNKMGIPYTFVDHLMLTPVNKMFYEDFFVETWVKAKELGSRFVTVSEYAKKWKEEQYQKFNPDFYFDNFFKFQFVTSELAEVEVKAGEGYGTQIARPSKEKNLNRFAKMTGEYKILSNGDPEKAESCDKVINSILWNRSRQETMDVLSRASYFYATSNLESAGIAPFEALCSGVPVVLYDNGAGHTSYMFAPKGAWYVCRHDETDKIEKYKTLTLEQRQEISAEVRDFNHSSRQFADLLTLINSVQSTPKPSLETFMS